MDDSVPGGTATQGGGICTTCPHGKIEVIVWKHAICWDTPTDKWENAEDPGFEGVTVRINEVVDTTTQSDGTQVVEYHSLAEQVTGADGKVTFDNLLPFDAYKVTASRHPDHMEVTQELAQEQQRVSQGNPPSTDQPGVESGAKVQLRNEGVAVEVGKTSYADLVLRKKKYRENRDGTWTQGRSAIAGTQPASGSGAGLGKLSTRFCGTTNPACWWLGTGPGSSS